MSEPRRWPFTISVVIPARNETHTIAEVVRGVAQVVPDAEIIVVDDASSDDTADKATDAGATVIRRPHNIGNGAGVKTGVRAAHGEVVVILDADGQHNPADMPKLLQFIGTYDMVIGERNRAGQQNITRWLGNTILNRLGSFLIEMEMRDLTSGYRAMRRDVMMEFLHLLPNKMSWPTTSALAFAKAGYHIRFEPIPVAPRRTGHSAQKLFRNGIRFTGIILRITTLFAPMRIFFPVSVTMGMLSIISFLLSYFVTDIGRLRIPNSAVALFVGGVIVFMFGLLAEQIAGLRFQRRDQLEKR
ncbi:MAG: glycosyltransferase family 2 protein [Chloroflexia bacterium]|nr:glycosyltransferase family 2 protein [Chloroflexia bacterium]